MVGSLNCKKIIPFRILELLKTRTDKDHRLTQQDIIRLLSKFWGLDCDRRTVASSIALLSDGGDVGLNYPIVSDKGYYLASGEFNDAELKMLIDSVLFSKVLTKPQSKELIRKIKNLGNDYFRQSVPEVEVLSGMGWSENARFWDLIAKLNQAIQTKKKVEFSYRKYDENLKLQVNDYVYKVNPYYLLANNGYYYLVGNLDKYDNVGYYRIDRICQLDILDEKVKPKKLIRGLSEIWDLPKHLAEHTYMFSGDVVDVQIKTTKGLVSDFVDWFGKDIRIKTLDKDNILITVRSNENAIFYWLLQYGLYVEVMQPQSLRDRMKEAAKELIKKYC